MKFKFSTYAQKNNKWEFNSTIINRALTVSLIIIIALICSGVAFVYHYSEAGSAINVKISGIPDVIVEGTSIQFKSDLIGYNGGLSYRWCVNSTFLSLN